MSKITELELKEQLLEKSIEIINYDGNWNNKQLLKCLKDNHIWENTPYNLLYDRSHCPKCRQRGKYSEESLNIILKDRSLEVLKYGGSVKVKSTIKCLKDNYVWEAKINNILSGKGCPKCAKRVRYTEESVKELIKDKNFKLITFGGTANKHSTFQCLIDDHIWTTTVANIYTGTGCPKCAGLIKFTEEDVKQKLLGKNIELIRYGGTTQIPSDWKCLKCDHIWTTSFSQINSVRNTGCPMCCQSQGEKLINKWLKENNIKFKHQFELIVPEIARNTNSLVVDFFVKHNNKQYFIEYDGKQHFEYVPFFHKEGLEDLKKQQNRDRVLNEFCELHKDKVILIRFRYDDSSSFILEQLTTKILNEY